MRFIQRLRARRIARLARDLDDVRCDLDPYGYMDSFDETGLTFDDMHAKGTAELRGLLHSRDRSLLEGVRALRDGCDDIYGRRTRRRLDRLVRRTRRVIGRR